MSQAVPAVRLTLGRFCFKQAGVTQAVTARSGAGGCGKGEVPPPAPKHRSPQPNGREHVQSTALLLYLMYFHLHV